MTKELKNAISRIRKAQNALLEGKIENETTCIELDCMYHKDFIVSDCKSINACFSVWKNGELSQEYFDLCEDHVRRVGGEDEIPYDEFFEFISNHIGYQI